LEFGNPEYAEFISGTYFMLEMEKNSYYIKYGDLENYLKIEKNWDYLDYI